MTRECGDCQLCCRLLPVVSLDKIANQKCEFQKFHKGCTVYNTKRMPIECRVWQCRWIVSQLPDNIARPDRVHYVVDVMPDNIVIQDHEAGKSHIMECIVVWCDPKHPLAYRNPELYDWVAAQNKVLMVRMNSRDSIIVFPPALNSTHEWAEVTTEAHERDVVTKAVEDAIKQNYDRVNKPVRFDVSRTAAPE
jgi:hypothetical protein